MTYSATLKIQPNTLTDLTVEIKHNLGVNTYTLSDFTVSGDNLEGYITYLHTSNQVTISSTGYHTVVTDISAITNTVVTLDLEFSNFEANSTKYYCKDETARNSITDINTALNGKVSKSGDTMSGRLHFASNSITDLRETFKFEDIILGTIPSETHFSGFQTFDSQDNEFANILCSYNSDGRIGANFYVRKSVSGGSVSGNMGVYINAQDKVYSTFPHTDCVDGQWVYKNTSLGSSVTWNTSSHSGAKSYSVSSYLPNDGQNYEIMVRSSATTASTSGKMIVVGVYSDIITTQTYVCRCRTRSSSTVNCAGTVILPVGTGRKIYVNGAGSETSADGTYDIACIGYRRIGTNE